MTSVEVKCGTHPSAHTQAIPHDFDFFDTHRGRATRGQTQRIGPAIANPLREEGRQHALVACGMETSEAHRQWRTVSGGGCTAACRVLDSGASCPPAEGWPGG